MTYGLIRQYQVQLSESRRITSLELAARALPQTDFTSNAVEAIHEGHTSFEMYDSANVRVGNQSASMTHTFKFRGRK